MLEQLLMFMCQVFAMRGDVFDAMQARVPALAAELRRDAVGGAQAMSIAARVESIDPLTMQGDVAVIDIMGPLSTVPRIWRLFGLDDRATYGEIEQAVNRAFSDDKVRKVLLRIESPGGTVAGCESLGNAIYRLRERKLVVSQCVNLACSAGYWLASQAHEIYALRSADLANIGAMGAMYDYHKYFAELGIEAVVARSTPLKGIGFMGAEVTAEHRAELQRWIGGKHELFVDAVARGRGMDRAKVAKLADARVLNGDEALAAGLIDRIQGFEDTMNELARGGATRVGGGMGGGSAGGRTLGLSDGARAMKKELRQYLESVGLSKDATEAAAWTFFNGLAGEQKRKAEAIRDGQAGDGGQANGQGQPSGQASAGGDSGGTSPPSGQAGGQGGQQGGGQQQAGPTPGTSAPAEAGRPSGGVAGLDRSVIQGLASMAGLAGSELDQFVTMHTVGASSEAVVRQELFNIMRNRMQPVGSSRTTVGDDGRESMMAAMTDVFTRRMGGRVETPHARAAQFEHLTAIDCGRQWLQQLGHPMAMQMSAEEVALAMTHPRHVLGSVLGSVALTHTTSDFASGVLGTSANRSLAEGFMRENTSYQLWARNEELPNLQEHEEHSVGQVPLPKRVLEGAEYELVTFSTKAEKKQVFKYGLRLALTLEMIINDMLGAFSEQVMDFGGSARALRNQLVYAKLSDNPTMTEDATALFHADHNNLNESGAGGTPMSIASEAEARAAVLALNAMRKSMRLQKGIAPKAGVTGANLNIIMDALLVPVELDGIARVLVGSPTMPGQSNMAVPNVVNAMQGSGSLQVISDPELSDSSTTRYFGVNKRKSPVKSLTLRGYAQPTIRRRDVSAVDGIEYQLRDFAGAAAVEWRSAQRDDGA